MRHPRPSLVVVALETCAVALAAIIAAHFLGFRLGGTAGQPPTILRISPEAADVGIPLNATVSVLFSESLSRASINSHTFALEGEDGAQIASTTSYDPAGGVATLTPLQPLRPGATYRVTIRGGRDGVTTRDNRRLATARQWSFTTGVPRNGSPLEGAGGPILVLTSAENSFTQYYPEILRAEGLNEFTVANMAALSRGLLDQASVVLVGDVPLDASRAAMIEGFVQQGGTLIAMRPGRELCRRFGLVNANQPSIRDGYLSIDAHAPYGAGLVHEPIQFHGAADRYAARGIASDAFVATLYTNGTDRTSYPAVVRLQHGRGIAAFFAYDLARSVVETHQGNPAWSGQDRDGAPPIRSDDLFYGNARQDPQPDWVDRQKVAIPQADEQQRLLANLILASSHIPMPRFWYLPRGARAALIMTGDDHDHGGTWGRFHSYLARSPQHCSAQSWECIHGTSYIFDGSLPADKATTLDQEGFEIALHISTDCQDWAAGGSHSSAIRHAMDDRYSVQLAKFAATFPQLPRPATVRTHCIAWGDYDTQPLVELLHGIRLDTNYYYWPPSWVKDQPGLFTGSAMPMRFATRDGAPIDVYQAVTQMTDESGQTYPYTFNSLLDNALGPKEYIGVFTANLHNDLRYSSAADAVVTAALARHVPIVSAVEMLHWLDGRNQSSFDDLSWADGRLRFSIAAASGANGLEAMLPLETAAGHLTAFTSSGAALQYAKRSFAGVAYATFPARPGEFVATYSSGK